MNNEKLENILNLALNATPEEREKSLELNIGYDTASRSWEVIAKASGGFTSVVELFPQITVRPLLNGYTDCSCESAGCLVGTPGN